MSYHVENSLVTLFVIVFLAAGTNTVWSFPTCSSTSMEQLSPKARNLCSAYYEFSNAVKEYVEDSHMQFSPVNFQRQSHPLLREITTRDDYSGIYENPVKRHEDVDHVFLRFGRRR